MLIQAIPPFRNRALEGKLRRLVLPRVEYVLMKVVAYGIAVVVILSGAVFALQGLSLLPSRVMYGKPEWIVIGVAMVMGGIAALAWLSRRMGRS